MSFVYKGKKIPTGGNLQITAGDGIIITEKDSGTEVDIITPVRGIFSQEEFDALPEEQRNKGLYFITDSAANSTEYPKYSTSPQRVSTWINGEPVYQVVIPLTLPSEPYKEQALNIDYLNIDKIIKMEGMREGFDNFSFYYEWSDNKKYGVNIYFMRPNLRYQYAFPDGVEDSYKNTTVYLILTYTEKTV